jgi:hypothetical protein
MPRTADPPIAEPWANAKQAVGTVRSGRRLNQRATRMQRPCNTPAACIIQDLVRNHVAVRDKEALMTTAHGHGGSSVVGPQQPQRWVLWLALFAITAVGLAAIAVVVNWADTPVSQETGSVAVGATAVLSTEQLAAINHLLAHESAVGATAVVGTEQLAAINHLLAHESAVGATAVVEEG